MDNMINEDNEPRPERRNGSQIMRNVFGAFMVVIYVGVGILLLINWFRWDDPKFDWVRYVGGCLFIAYGIWRAYRQIKGIDSNI